MMGQAKRARNTKEAMSKVIQDEKDYLKRQIELDRRLIKVEQRIARLEKELSKP